VRTRSPAAQLVDRRFADPAAVDHADVKALEHVGDDLTGEIINLLNTQYVTPFDREDIYGLAKSTDDVLDHMDHASELLRVYRITETTESARKGVCGARERCGVSRVRARKPPWTRAGRRAPCAAPMGAGMETLTRVPGGSVITFAVGAGI